MEVIMALEETEDDLIHCIYVSAATAEFSPADLEELLSVSRKNNEALGVTGMLLYEKGSFFQILEGTREAVEPLYAKIDTDKRHSRITKLIIEPIEERSFANWSRGRCLQPLQAVQSAPLGPPHRQAPPGGAKGVCSGPAHEQTVAVVRPQQISRHAPQGNTWRVQYHSFRWGGSGLAT